MKPKMLFSGQKHVKMRTNRLGSHFSLYLCRAFKQWQKRRKKAECENHTQVKYDS